jgi:hypothetical protein
MKNNLKKCPSGMPHFLKKFFLTKANNPVSKFPEILIFKKK